MTLPLDECDATHPTFGIRCLASAHPHRQAHHWMGTGEGTHTSVFWWDLDGDPDEPRSDTTGASANRELAHT